MIFIYLFILFTNFAKKARKPPLRGPNLHAYLLAYIKKKTAWIMHTKRKKETFHSETYIESTKAVIGREMGRLINKRTHFDVKMC